MAVGSITSYQKLLGNYSISIVVSISECITSYQKLLGNYSQDLLGDMALGDYIIPKIVRELQPRLKS